MLKDKTQDIQHKTESPQIKSNNKRPHQNTKYNKDNLMAEVKMELQISL